jgi:hypothetical protein
MTDLPGVGEPVMFNIGVLTRVAIGIVPFG